MPSGWVMAATVPFEAAVLDRAFKGIPLGIALYNTAGEFIRVNPALCALVGRPAEEILGLCDRDLAPAGDGVADSQHGEKRFVRPDGSIAWALASLFLLRDERGQPIGWVGTFQDITQRRRSEHRWRHMADHDPLTGVANRRRLIADLELHLAHAARANERGAVLLLDLDGFKSVNDTQGHEAGDELLSAVAISLKRRLRVTDALGRIGGDEFAVVLPHVDVDGAVTVANQLLEAVREVAPTGITASCGIALYAEAAGADEILARADRAMYTAKRRGRNRAVVATSVAAG
jgi:diguanylate cyclase (GGDEF)-like protein/PAS domain S-box-containing protein